MRPVALARWVGLLQRHEMPLDRPYGINRKHAAARYLRDAAIFAPFYLALDWASYIEPLGSFNITPWNPGPALAIIWMLWGGLANAPVVFAATFFADAIIRDVPGDY